MGCELLPSLLKVVEKKRFNDENSKKLHLLSGDDWYTMQAYRALNQALGRWLFSHWLVNLIQVMIFNDL